MNYNFAWKDSAYKHKAILFMWYRVLNKSSAFELLYEKLGFDFFANMLMHLSIKIFRSTLPSCRCVDEFRVPSTVL